MTHRFFVSPGSIACDLVSFDPAQARQLRSVLRLRPGARVIVLDNTGFEYEVELTAIDRDAVSGRVCARQASMAEPRLSLTLYQSPIKGDRFEWVLQKGTELGVSTFVPLLAERTILRGDRIEKKRSRRVRILREAAEQSGRGRLPHLAAPLPFAQACRESAQGHDIAILPWVGAREKSLSTVLRAQQAQRMPAERVALLIGPEGGFTQAEVALAEACGVRVVTMGPRTLRAETAGVAAAAIVLSALGEME